MPLQLFISSYNHKKSKEVLYVKVLKQSTSILGAFKVFKIGISYVTTDPTSVSAITKQQVLAHPDTSQMNIMSNSNLNYIRFKFLSWKTKNTFFKWCQSYCKYRFWPVNVMKMNSLIFTVYVIYMLTLRVPRS